MARSPDVLVDASPLGAPSINVPLRVGWLLRTSRLNPRTSPSLNAGRFAAELGVGPASITKWEKGSEDIGAVHVEGYERLIGLPAGSLRGAIEITRRSFRYPDNVRLGPPPPPEDLAELSAVVRPAMDGEPRGVDWLHLADALTAAVGPLVLPDFTAAPVIDRLTSELARSVGPAYLTRYEAMARLRTGRYRDVALASLLGFALAEDAQVSIDLLEVAGELPSAGLFATMCRLLVDERASVFQGACHSMSTMAALGGITRAEMRDSVPMLARAYNLLAEDPSRYAVLSDLLRNLPRAVRCSVLQLLEKAPVPLHPGRTVLTRDNPLYRTVRRLAEDIRSDLEPRENPMLDRLLFEAMFAASWRKQDVASLFLMAVPYRDVVSRHVAELAERHDRHEVRDAALALSLRSGDASAVATAEGWARDHDPGRQGTGLVTLGHWAGDIDPRILERSVRADWPLARRGLYAAGMSGSPVLSGWAADASLPERVRAGARWWLRTGSRVLE